MLDHKKQGVRLVVSGNRLRIEADLSMDWRKAGAYVLLLVSVILLIGSTFGDGVRNFLIEILLNLLQLHLVGKVKTD